MDAHAIAGRSGQGSPLQLGSLTTLVNANSAGGSGKGLSIVDSARRDLEATLQLLADRAQYITGASGAAIALRDGDKVLCRASSGSAAPDLGSCLDLSSGLSGQCVRTRTALRCDDTAHDPRVNGESCRRLGIASLAVMPIVRGEEVVGIFEVFSNKPRAFQERDLTALERLREMVITALDQAIPGASNPAPFAIHGTKVKVLAAAAGAGSAAFSSSASAGNGAAVLDKNGFITGLPGNPASYQEARRLTDRIQACRNCGFPVSEGRVLCLDCDAKGALAIDTGVVAGSAASPSGLKSWIVTNRYVIGMVLVSAATIVFALLR